MPWEETDDYIRSGHQDSSKFDEDSLRTIDIDTKQGIKAIVGCPKGHYKNGKCQAGTEVKSFLFSKKEGWTMETSKKWFESHKK